MPTWRGPKGTKRAVLGEAPLLRTPAGAPEVLACATAVTSATSSLLLGLDQLVDVPGHAAGGPGLGGPAPLVLKLTSVTVLEVAAGDGLPTVLPSGAFCCADHVGDAVFDLEVVVGALAVATDFVLAGLGVCPSLVGIVSVADEVLDLATVCGHSGVAMAEGGERADAGMEAAGLFMLLRAWLLFTKASLSGE